MTRTTRNILRGMGSIDLFPQRRPSHVGRGLNLHLTDAEALGRDWQVVANDFCSAVEHVVKEAEANVKQK